MSEPLPVTRQEFDALQKALLEGLAACRADISALEKRIPPPSTASTAAAPRDPFAWAKRGSK